jgi:hypothetical protein
LTGLAQGCTVQSSVHDQINTMSNLKISNYSETAKDVLYYKEYNEASFIQFLEVNNPLVFNAILQQSDEGENLDLQQR